MAGVNNAPSKNHKRACSHGIKKVDAELWCDANYSIHAVLVFLVGEKFFGVLCDYLDRDFFHRAVVQTIGVDFLNGERKAARCPGGRAVSGECFFGHSF